MFTGLESQFGEGVVEVCHSSTLPSFRAGTKDRNFNATFQSITVPAAPLSAPPSSAQPLRISSMKTWAVRLSHCQTSCWKRSKRFIPSIRIPARERRSNRDRMSRIWNRRRSVDHLVATIPHTVDIGALVAVIAAQPSIRAPAQCTGRSSDCGTRPGVSGDRTDDSSSCGAAQSA